MWESFSLSLTKRKSLFILAPRLTHIYLLLWRTNTSAIAKSQPNEREREKNQSFLPPYVRGMIKVYNHFIDFLLNGKLLKLSLFCAQFSNHQAQLALNCPKYAAVQIDFVRQHFLNLTSVLQLLKNHGFERMEWVHWAFNKIRLHSGLFWWALLAQAMSEHESAIWNRIKCWFY